MTEVRWYVDRLRRMSLRELAWRLEDEVHHRTWTMGARRGRVGEPPATLLPNRGFASVVSNAVVSTVPAPALEAVVDAADQLLDGQWSLLGVRRDDMRSPDWFHDPVTGRRAVSSRPAFAINHRDERQTGNVKQVWELSRHHHLTVLASAYRLTSDERYAELASRQLREWWRQNPVLVGIHWTGGIELGVRLMAWVWVRRLLDGWEGVEELFEDNPDAVRQIYWHQRYLATFVSRGSSANNHVIAEAAGRLVAACAFPWFPESDGWRSDARLLLQRTLRSNTFGSGINRELATDYHGFVAELAIVAAAEASAAGASLDTASERLIARMVDCAAAVVDAAGRPPRQGDGDEGRALVLDDPHRSDGWRAVLAAGAARYGAASWWPSGTATVQAVFLAAVGGTVDVAGRPEQLPGVFPDAGMAILRTTVPPPGGPSTARLELWCRCDGGPHGLAGIAGHAHADALSVEFRVDGVDVLADPGTYCYHGEPEWRSYFRSTRAHNTIEIGGQSSSVEGGPFLWNRSAESRVLSHGRTADGALEWSAEHDGYARMGEGATHRRRVRLDPARGALTLVDEVGSATEHPLRCMFHLGPQVEVRLVRNTARLTWAGERGRQTAVLELPAELSWAAHRGEQAPVLGWYSTGLGAKQPSTTLVGSGLCRPALVLTTTLTLTADAAMPSNEQSRSAAEEPSARLVAGFLL